MAEEGARRRLAAILSADVAGYSRLIADDDRATLETLKRYREAIRRLVEKHGGRVVNAPGDALLAEFGSALEALEAALEIQKAIAAQNDALPESRRMRFRIGLSVGDVLVEPDGTVYGDGVNIAARMEALAEPGGVCLSGTAYDHVKGKTGTGFADLGPQRVKNFADPVPAHRVIPEGASPPPKTAAPRRRTLAIATVAVLVVAAIAVVWGLAWRGAEAPPEKIIAEAEAEPEVASVERPSIAVLPFDNLSGDPEQDYFVDGLTEEIIGTLAHFPDLAVIARNSTFRYKGQAVDVRTVGEELGAKYIVEGSVRRAADTIRVTAQLIETETGSQLWSETYDRALTAENVFAIQDEIAAAIAKTFADTFGVLRQEGLAAARRKPPADLSSYDCVLLAMEHLRSLSAETNRAARSCLERAVVSDPDYAAAWSNLARVYVDSARMNYNPLPDALDRALDAAQRAVQLAPGDAEAHWRLAHAHFFRGELDAFKTEAERAIGYADKGSSVRGEAGLFLAYAGEWDRGLALIEEAKAFDPFYPGWYHAGAYFDHYRKGEYAQALAAAQSMGLPDYVWTNACVAAAYGELGKREDARPYVEKILVLDPDFEASARANRWKWFRYQEDLLDPLMDGLRKAGLNVEVKGS